MIPMQMGCEDLGFSIYAQVSGEQIPLGTFPKIKQDQFSFSLDRYCW
jgi:hypothetical protein